MTEEFIKLCEDLEHWETDEWAAREILNVEILTPFVLDPCAGSGILIKALGAAGYGGLAWDIHDWGFPLDYTCDFLTQNFTLKHKMPFTVFMNPPFSKAAAFVEKAQAMGARKVVCYQRFAWWESNGRRDFWDKNPPNRIYICGDRATSWLHCIPQAERLNKSGSPKTTPTAHAWYIWEDGQPRGPLIGRIYNSQKVRRKNNETQKRAGISL